MPQLGGHFWPTGERRDNTGITFLVADTMPIALGCQKAVRTAAFLSSTLRCKLQSQSIFFVLALNRDILFTPSTPALYC